MLSINAFKNKETLDSDLHVCAKFHILRFVSYKIYIRYTFFLFCFSDIDCRLNIYVCLW